MAKKKKTISESVSATQRDMWATYNKANKRSARNRLWWTIQLLALIFCLYVVYVIEFT